MILPFLAWAFWNKLFEKSIDVFRQYTTTIVYFLLHLDSFSFSFVQMKKKRYLEKKQ